MHRKIDTPTIERIDTPQGRRYRTPEGNLYPSVTTVLSAQTNDSLDAWRERVGKAEARKIANRAARRGTWIHEQCEYFLLGGDKFVKPGDTITSMLHFDLWKNYRPLIEKIGDTHAIERPLYSDKLRIAGTVDCIGYWDGKLSVIDYKTSSRIKTHSDIDNYWLQCSAYAYMWYERTGVPITQLVVLMAIENEAPVVFVDNVKNWIQKFMELRRQASKMGID